MKRIQLLYACLVTLIVSIIVCWAVSTFLIP